MTHPDGPGSQATPEAPVPVSSPVGADPLRVKFAKEKQRYTVMACNDRFVILTKPFNAQRTYLYTIADMERKVRGACNKIFGLPCAVDNPEGASTVLKELEAGEMEVSYRNCVDLSYDEVVALQTAIAQHVSEAPNGD